MKFIHVCGDSGKITVRDELDPDWDGWVYEAPNDFKLVLTLEEMSGQSYVYEVLGAKGLKIVKEVVL